MKKEITLAIIATILVLQLVGSFFGGAVQRVADGLSTELQARIHLKDGE